MLLLTFNADPAKLFWLQVMHSCLLRLRSAHKQTGCFPADSASLPPEAPLF